MNRKILLSCSLGTFLEFFDYTLYGYFSGTIGSLFFPNQNHAVQLLATWSIFATGFLIRPLGAFILGHIADRRGRSTIMPFTIILMALPTVAIGLLPTFQMAGWLAPLLLIICRLVQGVAISGEYNGAGIYIVENHWPRAGLLGALTPFSCGMGMLAASALTFLFTHMLGDGMLQWQWRLPFIIAGLLVGFIGWKLRQNLSETIEFMQLLKRKADLRVPFKNVFRQQKLALLTNIICSAYMGSASYLLMVYMASFLQTEFQYTLSSALFFTTLFAFIEACGTLLFGWLSDKTGRWQILFVSSAAACVMGLIFALQTQPSGMALIAQLIMMVILLSAFDGPLTTYLPELFRTEHRYSGTSIGYNIGGAAIGGLSPLFISLVLQVVRMPQLVLGLYLGGIALLSGVIIYLHQRDVFHARELQYNLSCLK